MPRSTLWPATGERIAQRGPLRPYDSLPSHGEKMDRIHHALAVGGGVRYSGAMNESVRAFTTGIIKRSAISIMGIVIKTTWPAGVRMGD